MVILNELNYVTQMLQDKERRYYNKKELSMFIKFLVKENYSLEETVGIFNDFMSEVYEDYIPEKYVDFIEHTYKKMVKRDYKLLDIDSLYLTDKEIELILTLKSTRQQKVLATIMLLSKMNFINRDSNIIFQHPSTIFSLANVSMSKNQQDDMIALFDKMGFIELDRENYDSLKFNVICLKDGKNEFEITEMEDVGKKIDKHIKLHYKGYKKCSECDKILKPKKTARPTCICKEGARKENIRKTLENRKK